MQILDVGTRWVGRQARAPRAIALATLIALAATLGVAVAPAPAGADTQTVSNTTSMTVPPGGSGAPDHSPASLYPSPVTVSGLTGTTTKVTVRLNGLSHSHGTDLDVLLVGPGGQSVVVLSDAGSNAPVSNTSPTFDDAAATVVPDAVGNVSGIGSGTYKPTNTSAGFNTDLWPSPAPAGPYGSTFASFNGTNPNGTWNLYVVDDTNGDHGTLTGGWTLTVETGASTFPGQLQLSAVEYRGTEGGMAQVTIDRVNGDDGVVGVTFATGSGSATAGSDYTAVSTTVSFADGQTSRTVDVPITQDSANEGIDELVPIALSSPTGGATLGSPTTGQIRVQDDDARANRYPLAIPATGTWGVASLYPSNIVVAGASGVVSDVNVTIDGLSHAVPMDVGLLLVAPNGASTLLMSDVGSGTENPASNLDITFDDAASSSMPLSGAISGGTFKPTDDDADDDGTDMFPSPAPAAPWGTTMAALNGTSPNGTWSLYVYDDAGGDIGSIADGWSLDITTATANAGGPYTTPEGGSVTFSGSTTPAIDGATYSWDVNGDGTFGDATGANPTLTWSQLGALGITDGPASRSVQVRATAGPIVITSTAATLTITNVVPTATFSNSGPVAIGSTADVSFSGQSDPSSSDTAAGFRYSYDLDDDGDWEIGDGTYAGSSTSATATVPTSVLSAVGTYEVNGRILDKDGGFTDDTTTITVTPPPNAPPVADAGDDDLVNEDDTVELDGTGSTDADDDPLTHSWTQTDGPDVTLDGDDTATPSFTAPEGPATLTFELTVDDGEATATDTVTITVNGPPTADAGDDDLVNEGSEVTLDGTGSADPDSDTLTYSWVQTAGPDVTLTGATTAEPTLTAPDGPATLTFQLTVSDGRGRTDTDTVDIAVNRPPTADAGEDDLVNAGDTVEMDGTDSDDPDDDPLTHSWVQTTGPAVTLTGANTATPSFTAPEGPATLTFQLTVSDGRGGTDTDTVDITVNGRPTADAGDDKLVNDGSSVTLDGTGSADPDSDTLTFSWVQTGGPIVLFAQPDTAQPSFVAPSTTQTLTFTLTVSDGRGRSHTDSVDITVNRRPTADAGDADLVNAGDTVTLDGTGSNDPDAGDTLTHSWVQTTGPAVTLTGATTATPSFTAPEGPATLTFQLTVDDGRGGTDTDLVIVTVNGRPTADAGDDDLVNGGSEVTLDGTGSNDPDAGTTLTHSWIQTAGAAVTLTGANTATPSFTAPTEPATLTFELTVDDQDGRTHADTVTITVNAIPEADAGGDQLVNLGDTAGLDGTLSSDADPSDILTYSWTQTGGTPMVSLIGATTAEPAFTAPEGPATLTFQLTIDDGRGGTDTDSVNIRVNGPPTADAGDDRTVNIGSTVTLDGADSSDPDAGTTLTHSWVQTAGAAVTLIGATTTTPSFTAPTGPVTLTFELTVQDGDGREDTDTVTVAVNGPPTADAGDDELANAGDTVTLDSTGSTDPDPSATLTYSWIQTAGAAVTLIGANTATPSFTAPTGPVTLTFEVTASAGPGRTDTDTVTITVNGRPIADAGPDQRVNLDDTVTLDGNGSSDPDSDTLTYSWAQTGGTPTVTLTGDATAQPTFTAPDGPAALTFTLSIDDGKGGTDTDTVAITVNGVPTAEAGDDVEAVERTTVTLDGSASDPDADTLTYSWVQTAGAAVTLTGATTLQPSFTVPDAPATVTFQLTVDDGQGRTATDTVTVTSQPRFTPSEAAVDSSFDLLLGRPSDEAGRQFWAALLASGATYTRVATLIAFSPEGTRRIVNQRYQAWLGRPAGAAALKQWTDRLLAGTPLLDLELALLSSDEFFQRAGSTRAGFVTELYEVLLGRSPDPASLSYWQGRLAAGSTRRTVANLILGSPEVERRRVDDAYRRILGRPADPSGLAYFADILDRTRDLRRVEVRLTGQAMSQAAS